MPIYEYVCRSCGGRFERIRPMNERLTPPSCGCGSSQTSLALSVPGRVGAGPTEAPVGPCGAEAGTCCGGRCMH